MMDQLEVILSVDIVVLYEYLLRNRFSYSKTYVEYFHIFIINFAALMERIL